MIRVDRGPWPAPDILTSPDVEDILRQAAAHFEIDDSEARQGVFPLPRIERDRPVLDTLCEMFVRKCAFCESLVSKSDRGRVHRLRPAQEAIGIDGEVSRPHYWWLAYDWENLYYSCRDCTRSAGSRFPVRGERGRPGAPVSAVRESERSLVIDPCWDEPREHLTFDDEGYVEPLSQAGEQTIELFRLNRDLLVVARRAAIAGAFDAAGQVIAQGELAQGTPYAAAIREALARFVEREGLPAPRLVAGPESRLGYWRFGANTGRHPEVEPLRLRRMELRNVRAIEHLTLEFPADVAPWTMLLGENGHGKTTVLRAIALALMGRAARDRLDLDADAWIRNAENAGEITVWLDGRREPRTLRLRRFHGFEVEGDDVPAALAGYGAGRLPPLRDREGLPRRYRVRPRIENLFDPHAEMMPATQWLLSLEEETFDFAARAVRRLLLEPESSRLYREGDRVVLDRTGEWRPLDQLSDGYRSMLTLAVDLMSTFLMRFGSLDAAEGIVLVDELSAHLHPRWQMRIVTAFREAFPRLQVIATTHDPLCLRGLQDEEVVVLRRDGERRVYRLPPDEVPPVRGLRVDELMTSEIFGLNSTVDVEIDTLFRTYYDLLGRHGRTSDAESELARVREELDRHRQFGTTRRERLALEAADRYVAEEQDVSDPGQRDVLSEEMRRELRMIWSGED